MKKHLPTLIIMIISLFLLRIAFYEDIKEIINQGNTFSVDRNSGITYVSSKNFDIGVMLLGDCILKTNWVSSLKLNRYTGKIVCNREYQADVTIRETFDLEQYATNNWINHNDSNYIYINHQLNSVNVVDSQNDKTLSISWDSNSDDFFNELFRSFHNRLNVHSLSKHQEYFIEYEVKEAILSIDSEKDYTTKVLNNEDFLSQMTDGGGELTGYFKDGELKKVGSKISLSYGVTTNTFYLSDNSLIAVIEIQEIFPYDNDSGTFNFERLDKSFEGLYYFDDGKIVNQESSGEKRLSDNETISELEKKYNQMFKDYTALLLK